MKIVVLGNERYREELGEGPGVQWISTFQELISTEAEVYVDLLFENHPERVDSLKQLAAKTMIINCNLYTITELNAPFVRINGWNSFLKNSVECYADNEQKEKAEEAFALLGWKAEWLPDQVGFVTPRVVSMIINEAFFALSEGVSSKEEIDTAMKLGTAYPYGPFEWAEKIGPKNVYQLLERLSKDQPRYTPADLLQQTTNSSNRS